MTIRNRKAPPRRGFFVRRCKQHEVMEAALSRCPGGLRPSHALTCASISFRRRTGQGCPLLNDDTSSQSHRTRLLRDRVIMALLIGATAWVSLHVTRLPGEVSAVWVSSGIFVGWLLSRRTELWPGYVGSRLRRRTGGAAAVRRRRGLRSRAQRLQSARSADRRRRGPATGPGHRQSHAVARPGRHRHRQYAGGLRRLRPAGQRSGRRPPPTRRS